MSDSILDPLKPTVLTAQGELSNVEFNEEDLIKRVEPTDKIHRISCNFGVKTSESFSEEKKEKKSNRGRKKKEKEKGKRRNQGNGNCFNSQMTFWVYSIDGGYKYYKVKVFRNGKIGIPGGLNPDMSDINYSIKSVIELLSNVLNEEVEIVNLYSTMRNYKTSLKDKNKKVNLTVLYNLLLIKSEEKYHYMKNVVEIKFNPERYEGLTIKFSTPTEYDNKKKTTIKLFRSGKINIDGAISEEGAEFHYNWISNLYYELQDQILYEPKKSDSESSSDSGDE